MKSMRISMITLAVGLAGATAAWGAESVMNLISTGDAITKQVADTKAAAEAAEKHDKELAQEGRDLTTEAANLNKENAAFTKENSDLNQRISDYNSRCNPKKQLNQDEYNACKADGAQLNQDVAKVNADKDTLNKHINDVNARIPKHNEEIKGSGQKVKDAFADYDSALKREGVWLDQVRDQISSEAFKPYGQKAGCPDVTKPAKTAEALSKMADDVLACLKRVSNT